MTFADTIETALKQVETILGSKVFTYDDENFPCHVGSQTIESVLEAGGIDVTQQIVLIVRKSVFTDSIFPQEDEKITYNEVVYFVDKVQTDASDTFLNIPLKRSK